MNDIQKALTLDQHIYFHSFDVAEVDGDGDGDQLKVKLIVNFMENKINLTCNHVPHSRNSNPAVKGTELKCHVISFDIEKVYIPQGNHQFWQFM